MWIDKLRDLTKVNLVAVVEELFESCIAVDQPFVVGIL